LELQLSGKLILLPALGETKSKAKTKTGADAQGRSPSSSILLFHRLLLSMEVTRRGHHLHEERHQQRKQLQ
jgi:hypothetical protein